MNALQRIELKRSELRSQINAELDKSDDDKDREALETLSAELSGLEVEYRAALIASDDGGDPDEETDEEAAGPEEREYREMLDGAQAAAYFEELNGAKVDGASRELREHSLGSNMIGYMPIDILLTGNEREYRADAVSDISAAIQDNQQSIAGRLFKRSDSMYLGAMMPTVAVGTVSYPRLNAGTSAFAPKVGVGRDAAAATLETKSIDPQRLTASYLFGVETLAKVSGWEAALRQDLRETMNDKLDDLIVNGQAAETDGDGTDNEKFAGLLNTLTAGGDVGSGALAWATVLKLYDDLVDGLTAYSDEDVSLLVGTETWKAAMALEAGTNGNAGLMRDRIERGRFRVSGRIPAAATKKQQTIAAKMVPDRVRGLYVPVWRGMELIVDPYTNASKGQRKITAVMIVGAEVVDARAYSLRSVVLTA